MAGGNDGLNTIVPYTDGAYYQARARRSAIQPADVIVLNGPAGYAPRARVAAAALAAE